MPDIVLALQGFWKVDRQCRRTGKMLPPLYGSNTIQTAGKYDFLDLMFDLNIAGNEPYDNAASAIKVGTSVHVLNVCEAGYPSHPGSPDFGVCYWQWKDQTADTYDASTITFYNEETSVNFSIKTGTGWGTKPSSENWTYNYTLELTNGGDGDFQDTGLDHAMRLFTENRDTSIDGWGDRTGGIELYVSNSTRATMRSVGVDTPYPTRSGTTVTAVFTEPVGTGTGQQWWYVALRNASTDDPGTAMTLSETAESRSTTKQSSEEFVYTYTFSL